MIHISYGDALSGVVSEDDREALLGLVEHTKQWGNVKGTVPSMVITSLVDEIKKLKEQQLNFYQTHGIKEPKKP